MRRFSISLPVLLALLVTATTSCRAPIASDATDARAQKLVQEHIIVDGHIDLPYRLSGHTEDVSVRTQGGDFDYVRAKRGGLNAPFMSIYIPTDRQAVEGSGRALADSLIDLVQGLVEADPDKFAIATSTEDVRRHFHQGLISLPMGMENGAPIGDDLENLGHFFDRGIRYITLAHSKDNQISDSSGDTTNTWNGLSPFGVEVVREMNRLGIIVDVSHISDEAFYDVIRETRAPVIASHSSARALTPGQVRNMNDAMIEQLAENGGVIMISFGSLFLGLEPKAVGDSIRQEVLAEMEARGLDPESPQGRAYYEEQRKLRPVGTLGDVVDHIDHVVRLVGVDHVGIGSDFDGVFALPEGLQDASDYPNLVSALLRRGYSEEEISKILGQNALRVWSEVERVAAQG